MANVEGIITLDVGSSIAIGLTAYDNESKKVGTVDVIDRETGYVGIRSNPFSDKDLYVPFSLITNIDPHDLFFSMSKSELRANYTNRPPRSTFVEELGGKETAVTSEPSGYDGTPRVVESVRIDSLKKRIAVGDHVYSSDMVDLGTIERYDRATGWMMVEKRAMPTPSTPQGTPDLLIPVTLVEQADKDAHTVYLVWSEAELRQRQHLEPANVVFVEAEITG